MNRNLLLLIGGCLCFQSFAFAADEPNAPAEYTYRVYGLFTDPREKELREIFKTQIPEIEIFSIDMKTGEGTFKYNEEKLFGKGTKEQLIERFNNKLRGLTRGLFGISAREETPADKLEEIKIDVIGLDCTACCYAASQIVYQRPGVKQARTSFKDGVLTALVEKEKFNRTEAEEALKQQGVLIKTP
jgi:hypothetical protein